MRAVLPDIPEVTGLWTDRFTMQGLMADGGPHRALMNQDYGTGVWIMILLQSTGIFPMAGAACL